MKTLTKALFVFMLLVPVTALLAETTYEVKSGTVVSTFGDQLVVRLPNGEVKEYTIPVGFKFNVDGKEVGLSELTPGTQLTAVIKTTKTPETVKTVKLRNGEVVKVQGSTLWYKEDNQIKTAKIPKGFQFDVNGQKTDISQLTPGMKLTAEVVTTTEKVNTSRETAVRGTTPPPPPAPEPAAAPAPEPAPEPVATTPAALPKTATSLPLIALLGAMMVAAGVAIRRA